MKAQNRGAEGATVLVVDDELGMRRACARMLEAAGFEVLAADSGPEALALLEAHPGRVHLAVIDVVMPEMTGPELARKLRERWRGLKVLFMSGYDSDEIGDSGAMEPGAPFIGKPFSRDVLVRKVREILGGAPSSGT